MATAKKDSFRAREEAALSARQKEKDAEQKKRVEAQRKAWASEDSHKKTMVKKKG